MTDPFALHELAAVNALPDPRPIAALLRSDTPMPDGARHLLAELFHPGNPPITDWEVLPQRNPEFARMIRKLSATVNYRQALADGTAKGKAEEAAGSVANITARQARRWVQENIPEQLRARLRSCSLDGLDILAPSNVQHEPFVIAAMSMPG